MHRLTQALLMPMTAVGIAVVAPVAQASMTSPSAPPTGTVVRRVIACPEGTVCFDASKGNNARVDVDLGASYISITELCFTIKFKNNLLDPGEEFYIEDVGGKANIGTEPLSSGTLCATSPQNDDLLLEFLDGTGSVTVFMFEGSSTLKKKAGISVTGTR